MERYVNENEAFRGRKVFINTIPGYLLDDKDLSALIERFHDHLDCFVFELLEDSPTSYEELARLKQLCKSDGQAQIAIDDYGTGHSNIINLLRYAPQIIKIDRGLITGIESDHNRRLFVQNTIDFAHQNGIKALAEGVETLEELNTVIECGIDLIQGYYTGRPSEQPLADISGDVRNRLIEANLQIVRYDKEAKFYFPQDGEEISLLDIALQRYTAIMLQQGSYKLNGEASHKIDFTVFVADGAKVQLTVRNVSIKGIAEPTIQLGAASELELILEGENTLDKEGILVPATASLTVRGDVICRSTIPVIIQLVSARSIMHPMVRSRWNPKERFLFPPRAKKSSVWAAAGVMVQASAWTARRSILLETASVRADRNEDGYLGVWILL